MKQLTVDITHRNPVNALKHLHDLMPYCADIKKQISRGYATPFAFAYALDDFSMIETVKHLTEQKKTLNPSALFIIGIGGSNLGTMAVIQALRGRYYNDQLPGMQFYYADTVDSDYINELTDRARAMLENGKQILINVVSKSGTTTETIANFEIFYTLLKQYRPNTYADYIVVTTGPDTPLQRWAQQNSWSLLEVPEAIGGRFSVLSSVGLFPFCMLGIDVDELLQGARDMRDNCLVQEPDNSAMQSAVWQYMHVHDGWHTSNLFLFSNELNALGNWWRQLVGESLGKACTLDEKGNQRGILPITSIGTTDLHSVGQLYLADIIKVATQFVIIEQPDHNVEIAAKGEVAPVAHIRGHMLHDIMTATIKGVQEAYTQKGLPFYTIRLPEKRSYSLGQFLQYKLFEICYLGHMLNVNTFDQPEVELYKSETRKILAHE